MFFGDSSMMVVDVGGLSGRQIATVWPGTSFVSKPGAEVVFSLSGFILKNNISDLPGRSHAFRRHSGRL